MGQAGRAYRSLERPRRKVGGKGQGKGLMGRALAGVFFAGMDAIRAERATRPPEISFWEPTRALREQPGGAHCHTGTTAGAGVCEKRFIHCPRWTEWNQRNPAQTLTAQESAATHIHKPPPFSKEPLLGAILAGGSKLTLI